MKITWLSGYPKSGTTWLRAFLSAYVHGSLDINNMQSLSKYPKRRGQGSPINLIKAMILDLDEKVHGMASKVSVTDGEFARLCAIATSGHEGVVECGDVIK